MKQPFLLTFLAILLMGCSEEVPEPSFSDLAVQSRTSKHIQVKVKLPNSSNAVGEELRFYEGNPDCICEDPGPQGKCVESPANKLVSVNSTDKNGKVKLEGFKNGFKKNQLYTVCIEYIPLFPCNLNHFEYCLNSEECTFAAKCQTFTVNKRGGVDGQITFQK